MLVALFAGPASAQSRDFPVYRAPLQAFEPGEGLAGLAQTSDGFLWTATRRALLRFDGVETRRFTPAGEQLAGITFLPRWLARSRDDRLWLPSAAGLVAFDPVRETFTRYRPKAAAPSREQLRVGAVVEDAHGGIWACTGAGIARVDPTTRTFEVRHVLDRGSLGQLAPAAEPRPPRYDYAQRAVRGPGGQLWIGTHYGVCRFDPDSGRSRRLFLQEPGQPCAVGGIAFARSGLLWVGTAAGLYCVDPRAFTAQRVESTRHLHVTDLGVDAADRVWVSTVQRSLQVRDSEGRLLSRLRLDGVPVSTALPRARATRFRPTDARIAIRSPAVRNVLHDRAGRVWAVNPAGLWSGDIATGFETYRVPGIADEVASHGLSAWSDSDGTMWFGCNQTGLHRIAADGLSVEQVFVDAHSRRGNVWACRRDARGDLWFSDSAKLLRMREPATFETATFAPRPSLVSGLHEDASGKLLAVARIDGEDCICVYGLDALRWAPVEHLAWDAATAPTAGEWFCGTSAMLLWDAGARRAHRLPLAALPPDCRVREPSCCGDGAGGFWLLGHRDLHHFEASTGRPRSVPSLQRLLAQGGRPTSITRGPNGTLWLFTARSAFAFDPLDEAWRSFGGAHGLPDTEIHASRRTPSGHIVLATDEGVVRFDPEEVLRSAPAPDPMLLETRVAGEPVQRGPLELGYRQDLVSFRFAAVLEREPRWLEYSFRLDGIDADWRSNGSHRELTFANLPAGRYRLIARARRTGEAWSAERGLAELVIHPPWWGNGWFRAAIVIAAALTLLGFYRLRTRAMRERAAALQLKNELQSQLAESRRLESLGRLAGGVSHDFNNIMTALLGHSELLELAVEGAPAAAMAEVQEIRRSCDRATELTRQLLAFSRRQVQVPSVFDPGPVLRQLVPMVRRLIPSGIELTIDVPEGLGRIRADRGQLEQVVVNLVTNARDALPNGGRIAIQLTTRDLDRAHVAQHPDAREGPHLVVSVTDNGQGIPSELLPHVFEPFFTTKPLDRGTGLGLASAFGIVHQSGGHITVTSRVGEGTEFGVHFPMCAAPASPMPERAATPVPDVASAERTVLLCDDDPAIVEMATRALTRHGYRVVSASSPRIALELVREQGVEVDLLVTDLVMPGMRGGDLARAIREHHPELPVLFISGYSEEDLPELDDDLATDFLAKPFSGSQIAERLVGLMAAAE